MALIAAAIAGAAAIGGGALASSGGKKADNTGQETLAAIAKELFSETGPLRAKTIQDIMGAMSGRTSEAGSGIAVAQESAITASGARQKESAKAELSKRGLANSEVGLAATEDIDRAIANLITQAKTQDVQSLVNLGRTIGFGQAPTTATNAASSLAGIQAQQANVASLQSGQTGAAAGNLLSLILQRQLRSNTQATGLSGSYSASSGAAYPATETSAPGAVMY